MGKRSAALFLDINKAFDSVWHKGILYKLYLLKCPRHLILLVDSFLRNRELQVRINTSYSNKFPQEQGVPQGSPLSPLLYNIYCHDIYDYSHNTPDDFNKDAYILQYADDTVLVAHGKTLRIAISGLQILLNKTVSWFNNWRLKPNPLKSQFIIFNYKSSDLDAKLTIGNRQPNNQIAVKYLGITLDNKLNFKQQSQVMKKQCISRAKFFSALTYRKSGISVKTASCIYKSICRPLLVYAHPLYLSCLKTPLKNINTAETSSLRIITKMRHPQNPLHNPSNDLLYKLTKVEPIEERLSKLSRRLANNVNVAAILDRFCLKRTENQQSKYRIPKQTILEVLAELKNQ